LRKHYHTRKDKNFSSAEHMKNGMDRNEMHGNNPFFYQLVNGKPVPLVDINENELAYHLKKYLYGYT